MKQSSSLVPKLRFPEFRNAPAWEMKALAPFLEEVSERVPSETDLPIYSSTRTGLKPQDDYYDGNILLNKNDYGVVPAGCFVYRHMSADGLFKFNFNDTGKSIAVSKEYPVFKSVNLESRFLLNKLNFGADFRQFAMSQKAGGTRTRLYLSKLAEWNTPLPKLDEQQKIAECLSTLDELIGAESQKLDTLKAHKKGLMQHLFPREGETIPRLRFPEFHSAPEWVEKKVGDIFKVTRGQVLAMGLVKDQKSSEAPYPVYSSQTKNSGLCGFYTDYLYQDAITWTTDGANAGGVNLRSGNFYCTNVCGVLSSAEGYANKCVAALIGSVSRRYVSYVGNPKLMNGVMSEIVIAVPSVPEQHRIATCLSSLEELIAAHSDRLFGLQTHKQGLLQQLFLVPTEDAV